MKAGHVINIFQILLWQKNYCRADIVSRPMWRLWHRSAVVGWQRYCIRSGMYANRMQINYANHVASDAMKRRRAYMTGNNDARFRSGRRTPQGRWCG